MDTPNDDLQITLKFGVWSFPMTVRRQEERVYRQAELLIKERYNYYTSKYRNQSAETYLVMTILDIAVMFKAKEAADDLTPIAQRLSPLLEELESALSTGESATTI